MKFIYKVSDSLKACKDFFSETCEPRMRGRKSRPQIPKEWLKVEEELVNQMNDLPKSKLKTFILLLIQKLKDIKQANYAHLNNNDEVIAKFKIISLCLSVAMISYYGYRKRKKIKKFVLRQWDTLWLAQNKNEC